VFFIIFLILEIEQLFVAKNPQEIKAGQSPIMVNPASHEMMTAN